MSAAYTAVLADSGMDLVTSGRDLQRQHAGLTDHDQDLRTVLLRNIGGKPLRLYASLLAEGGNGRPGATHWHEIALYRTDGGQIALALRLLSAAPGDLGVHRARVFADLEAACDWLEQFDGAADLDAGFDVADRLLSAPSLAVKAASLRERAGRLDRAYRGLVGEILFRLESDAQR